MAVVETFQDLSGSCDIEDGGNPYQGLIDACNDDAVQMSTHERNIHHTSS